MAEENENIEVSERFRTLDLGDIDQEYLQRLVRQNWTQSSNDREEFLSRREEWMGLWRNLVPNPKEGPWENSANFHVPMPLIYGKAIHARLFQIFSDQSGLFDVRSRREAFEDKETSVKEFMDWVVFSWANQKSGIKDTMDDWLWDVVFEGSGYLKTWWNKEQVSYMDTELVRVSSEDLVFDRENLTGRIEERVEFEEEDVVKEDIFECPMVSRIVIEDIVMPRGQQDPQTSDYVIQRCLMHSDQLKTMAQTGQFDEEAVEAALEHGGRTDVEDANDWTDIKEIKRDLDGYEGDEYYTKTDEHIVYEWYGKAYVKKKVNEDEEAKDAGSLPREIVAWMHAGTGRILGWTYLHRVSPSGIRPIFKADFMRFPDRTNGVGVPELLWSISNSVDALYNLRVDNGTLASLPMGFYRANSGLKADTINIEPGTLYPVDDPSDVKMTQFPYLSGFGEREEGNLSGYAERLLSIGDLQLGITPDKVGGLRNATGANLLSSESSIQLQIHFDRLARTLNKFLQNLFRLTRQRMPKKIHYRVMGENGEPIFGENIDKQSLMGDFDFDVKVDILGQSKIERQQKATLNLQTMMNPAFMQSGIVTPENLYRLARQYLKSQDIHRVDDFITQPQGYQGEPLRAEERLFRIVVGAIQGIEDTVRMDEDHQKALAIYDQAKQDDEFLGRLTAPQLAALAAVEQRHQQMLASLQGVGVPNQANGMQLPQDGLTNKQSPVGGGGQTLQAQQTSQGVGTPNGPMV